MTAGSGMNSAMWCSVCGVCLHQCKAQCKSKCALTSTNFHERKRGSEEPDQHLDNSEINPEKIGREGITIPISKADSRSSTVFRTTSAGMPREPRTQAASASTADWEGVMPDRQE